MLQLFNICKGYGRDSTALNDVSFTVDKGEFVYLTGPSGAGKSTLLRLLYCAERPTRGQIIIGGVNTTRISGLKIAHLRRKMGLVFQDFKLLPQRTVFENVAFPLEVQGSRRVDISKRVYQTLQFVGLEQKLKRLPRELSGGEQQRVAIARALVVDPLLLLADEPTGNLDPQRAQEIMDLFRGANARGTTVLLATHDRELLRNYPRRTLTLESGRLVTDQP